MDYRSLETHIVPYMIGIFKNMAPSVGNIEKLNISKPEFEASFSSITITKQILVFVYYDFLTSEHKQIAKPVNLKF